MKQGARYNYEDTAHEERLLRGRTQQGGSQLAGRSPYVYLGLLMHTDIKDELERGRAAAWTALEPLKNLADHLVGPDLRAGLFDLAVLPPLGGCAHSAASSKTFRNTYSALERCLQNPRRKI